MDVIAPRADHQRRAGWSARLHPEVEIDEILAAVDLRAWENKGSKRCMILVGEGDLKKFVANLRDGVLGRVRGMGIVRPEGTITFRHGRLGKVRQEVERIAQEPTADFGGRSSPRSTASTTVWGLPSGRTHEILLKMEDEGFFRRVRITFSDEPGMEQWRGDGEVEIGALAGRPAARRMA